MLWSMSIVLHGTHNLLSQIQHALTNNLKGRVALKYGVFNQALDDFCWILSDIKNRPTHIVELVPLLPSSKCHHDRSVLGAGDMWFSAKHLVPQEIFENKLLVWCLQLPQHSIDKLSLPMPTEQCQTQIWSSLSDCYTWLL